jgi:hypothetical protein
MIGPVPSCPGALLACQEAPPWRTTLETDCHPTPGHQLDPLSELPVMTPSLSQCARSKGQNCGKNSAAQGHAGSFAREQRNETRQSSPRGNLDAREQHSHAERGRGFPMVPTSGTWMSKMGKSRERGSVGGWQAHLVQFGYLT